MEPRPSIPLSRATLCLNCDRIYENGRRERAGDCPKCNSTHGLGLARIVRPLHEAQTPVVRVVEGPSQVRFTPEQIAEAKAQHLNVRFVEEKDERRED